jgi:MFS family permease
MVLCALISIVLVSYLVICWSFVPLFLTQVRGFAAGSMSWLMGTLGLSATVGSFVVTGISDRIGRRPIMIFTAFLGVILPLGALYYGGSTFILAAIFFFGWALTGLFPLFMGTIPSESVDARHMTTAMALVMGTGEVFGGVLSPTLAGWAADRAGLAAPLWIMFGLCVTAGTLALSLSETAPLPKDRMSLPPFLRRLWASIRRALRFIARRRPIPRCAKVWCIYRDMFPHSCGHSPRGIAPKAPRFSLTHDPGASVRYGP